MSCPCEKKKPCGQNPCGQDPCNVPAPKMPETIIEECPVLFHTVNIPASVGDVETMPPKNGDYKNARVYYEANRMSYLYDSDGIPQILSGTGLPEVTSVNNMAGDVVITLADLGGATAAALEEETTTRAESDTAFAEAIDTLNTKVEDNTAAIATKANTADVYTKDQAKDVIAEQIAELGVPSTYWGQAPNQGAVSGSITLEAGDGISWGKDGQAVKTDKFGTIITLRSKTATVGENTEYGQVNINHQGVTLRHVVNGSVPEGLKIVNLADGTDSKDAINLSQIQPVGWVDVENSGSAYNKAGSVVVVNISENNTFEADQWTTLFTLPEGFRPSITITGAGTAFDSANQTFVPAVLNITTDGVIQVSTMVDTTNVYANLTFMV